jgi:hypothetical protein
MDIEAIEAFEVNSVETALIIVTIIKNETLLPDAI